MLNKPNSPSLDNFWMPFTANRQFKAAPRLLASAEGMYYTDVDGGQVLDGTAGLWCVNAGHGRKRISEAVERQLSTLDRRRCKRSAAGTAEPVPLGIVRAAYGAGACGRLRRAWRAHA